MFSYSKTGDTKCYLTDSLSLCTKWFTSLSHWSILRNCSLIPSPLPDQVCTPTLLLTSHLLKIKKKRFKNPCTYPKSCWIIAVSQNYLRLLWHQYHFHERNNSTVFVLIHWALLLENTIKYTKSCRIHHQISKYPPSFKYYSLFLPCKIIDGRVVTLTKC